MMKAKCLYCGDEFEAQRSTARFCSDAHRNAYNYEVATISKHERTSIQAAEHLSSIATKWPDQAQRANEALAHISVIVDICRMQAQAITNRDATPNDIHDLAHIARTAIMVLDRLCQDGSQNARGALQKLSARIDTALSLPAARNDKE